jgi:hypothetical protein
MKNKRSGIVESTDELTFLFDQLGMRYGKQLASINN